MEPQWEPTGLQRLHLITVTMIPPRGYWVRLLESKLSTLFTQLYPVSQFKHHHFHLYPICHQDIALKFCVSVPHDPIKASSQLNQSMTPRCHQSTGVSFPEVHYTTVVFLWRNTEIGLDSYTGIKLYLEDLSCTRHQNHHCGAEHFVASSNHKYREELYE